MKTFYVYILKCSDGSYYVGVTNDIERRLEEHNKGVSANSFTFKRRPVELVFYETYNDFKIAEQWEKKLKGWSRKKKEALIERNWNKLKEYSVCQNDSHFSNFRDKNINHK
ncbi:putative endonuclease [Draconibacterium orientale]|uniref:Excinuclease ABC subunit C n=1 Tax=Draconibacterium orientale TaxID=1168034 RepID=X5DWR0_9BACT|nr:GIY-YIG nuclease family protein [Draconibacterium orientale]AHW58691.1 excinuclease ABC subunit C [Draconibacterium orientale]SET11163.1 putative endonuclease [Draconibacterium orientale]